MVTGPPVAASADGVRTYPIAPGSSVNVRSGPGTGYSIVKVLPTGTNVVIFCQTPGETVSGYYGTSKIWDNVGNGEFVADAYVKTGSDGYVAPRCA
ncbi:peptidase [Streptomyces kaempferi]|uniref:Peptidase n=1 Tax=Streptomyces kaempferi TaxID=333725 RepID=A0ABW3XSQ5_9ACTN